jgi:hydrogenase maturation protease
MKRSFHTLLLGLGNPILSDDRVGILVAERLHPWLDGSLVELRTAAAGGLRFLDMVPGYRRLVVIDALRSGEQPPGHVHVLSERELSRTHRTISLHDLGFGEALDIARALGLPVPESIAIYGIEVEDPFSLGQRFSERLAASLPEAMVFILAHAFPEAARAAALLALVLRNRRRRELAASPSRRRAVVGVILRESVEGPRVLLIRRAAGLARYPDRWSFPGGMVERDEHPCAALFRELQEELGLSPGDLQVLGRLDDVEPSGPEVITPYVLMLEPGAEQRPKVSSSEVAAITEAPLSLLERAVGGSAMVDEHGPPGLEGIPRDGERLLGASARIAAGLTAAWQRAQRAAASARGESSRSDVAGS